MCDVRQWTMQRLNTVYQRKSSLRKLIRHQWAHLSDIQSRLLSPVEAGWVRDYQNSEQLWPQGRDTTGYILELMELENIVANTVYLKAREGGPEGSKGRRYKKVYLLVNCQDILSSVWNLCQIDNL